MKYTDPKFLKIAGPIVNNIEFQKMKNIKHHDESVYEHVIDVAYKAYKITFKKDLDWESTIRGALLHDFYLYKFDKKLRLRLPIDIFLHTIWHPAAALENANRLFKLNIKEKDIIISHMFPVRIPKYKESWIVSMVCLLY